MAQKRFIAETFTRPFRKNQNTTWVKVTDTRLNRTMSEPVAPAKTRLEIAADLMRTLVKTSKTYIRENYL